MAILYAPPAMAAPNPAAELAPLFGSRPDVEDVSISPDGKTLAAIAPMEKGQGAVVLTMPVAGGPSQSRAVARAMGDPDRLRWCRWSGKDRVVCQLFAVQTSVIGLLPLERHITLDVDGGNHKPLSHFPTSGNTTSLTDAEILDWLPEEDGAVLMERNFPADRAEGFPYNRRSVERVDTRTLAKKQVEPPTPRATNFITDGHGEVRLVGAWQRDAGGRSTKIKEWKFRRQGSREWEYFAIYNDETGMGLQPLAINREQNTVYAVRDKQVLVTHSLDGSGTEKPLHSLPALKDSIDSNNRVVGVSYMHQTEVRLYFDPAIISLAKSLAKALPGKQVQITSSSVDKNQMLVWIGAEDDPGTFYVYDKQSRELNEKLAVRPQLDTIALTNSRPAPFTASDGKTIDASLMLPPGVQSVRGLPAIVIPEGGPDTRDERGFDWMAQYFATRGYAVLKIPLRHSMNGVFVWNRDFFDDGKLVTADLVDAGRWLLSQGVEPHKLGVLGRSYGGYAALLAAGAQPHLFKAVVAVGPLTNIARDKQEWRNFVMPKPDPDADDKGNFIVEGSPITYAANFQAPVLLFHGKMDRKFAVSHSSRMAELLKGAGKSVRLVIWDKLDHRVDDSVARTQMLSESDAFLEQAFQARP